MANPIQDQTATAGTALNFAFPTNTFADTDAGDTLTYTAIQSDDSALPSWLSFAAATRTFSGTPMAADVGTVSVKVTASDGTDSVSDTFDIVVSAAANSAGVCVTQRRPGSFTETVGDAAVSTQWRVGAVVTATDAGGYTLTYAWKARTWRSSASSPCSGHSDEGGRAIQRRGQGELFRRDDADQTERPGGLKHTNVTVLTAREENGVDDRRTLYTCDGDLVDSNRQNHGR